MRVSPMPPFDRRELLVAAGLALAGGLVPAGASAASAAPNGRRAQGPQRLSLWTMQLAPFHNAYVQGLIASLSVSTRA